MSRSIIRICVLPRQQAAVVEEADVVEQRQHLRQRRQRRQQHLRRPLLKHRLFQRQPQVGEAAGAVEGRERLVDQLPRRIRPVVRLKHLTM